MYKKHVDKDYNLLLKEADNLGIDWDESVYDPVGLEQEIEYKIEQERESQKDLYYGYYNSCVLGI